MIPEFEVSADVFATEQRKRGSFSKERAVVGAHIEGGMSIV